jgi:hypothetical protein
MIVSATTSRESLYVAMTRGKTVNYAHVVAHAADPLGETNSIEPRDPAKDAAAVLA